MVHQLLVLHEAPTTEMTSAGVPGDGAQAGGGGVGQQGGAAPLRKAVRTVGEQTRKQRPSHKGERVRGEVFR